MDDQLHRQPFGILDLFDGVLSKNSLFVRTKKMIFDSEKDIEMKSRKIQETKPDNLYNSSLGGGRKRLNGKKIIGISHSLKFTKKIRLF